MIHRTTTALQRCMLRILIAVLWTAGASGACGDALAQNAERIPCRPVSERTGEMGCWIISAEPIVELPAGPLFWHLDTYSTLTEAEAAKGQREFMARPDPRHAGAGCTNSVERCSRIGRCTRAAKMPSAAPIHQTGS